MRLCVWAFVALGLIRPAAGSQQTPMTFSVSAEAVFVDAFVTDRGATVSGLTADNFEVRDDGVRQRVSVVPHESMPLLAILAFDVSNSVSGEKINALRAGARAFMAGLRPADRIVLLSFNEEVRRQADEQGPDVPRSVLENLKARGTTSLYDAFFVALRVPDRSERGVLVLFTDGEDNSSWFDDLHVKRMAEESNVLIHVVGILPPPPERSVGINFEGQFDYAKPGDQEPSHVVRLRQIAELTGGHFWGADSVSRLEQEFLKVLDAMQNRYILRFEPVGVPKPGYHKLDVKLQGVKGDVHARRGYFVGSAAH